MLSAKQTLVHKLAVEQSELNLNYSSCVITKLKTGADWKGLLSLSGPTSPLQQGHPELLV